MKEIEEFYENSLKKIPEQLEACYKELETFGKTFGADDKIHRFAEEFEKMISTGSLTKKFLEDLLLDHLTTPLKSPSIYPLLQLSTYTHLAQQAHNRKQYEKAWCYISEARYYAGLISANYWALNSGIGHAPLARAGGAGKSEKYRPIKKFVTTLLKESRPAGGWKTERVAARTILKKVKEFNIEHKVNMVESNIENTLTGWMKKDPEIKAAYDAHADSPSASQ